jgi:hypothetical protein
LLKSPCRQGADAYWNWAQGAELSATAETRRLMLSVLLPGMELGRVATLEDRHLVATGKRGRYSILAELAERCALDADLGDLMKFSAPTYSGR